MCEKVLYAHHHVLVSPRAINAPWVYKEVQLAQTVKRARRDGYKVVPVLYDGVANAPFGHVTQLWKTFALLSNLERAVGNPTATTAARQHALDAYLAYRRAGGVSQSRLAELYSMGVQALATRQPTAVAAELAELAQHLDLPDTARPILAALQSLLAGTRDPALADDPHLDYDDTAAPRLLLDPPGSP